MGHDQQSNVSIHEGPTATYCFLNPNARLRLLSRAESVNLVLLCIRCSCLWDGHRELNAGTLGKARERCESTAVTSHDTRPWAKTLCVVTCYTMGTCHSAWSWRRPSSGAAAGLVAVRSSSTLVSISRLSACAAAWGRDNAASGESKANLKQ